MKFICENCSKSFDEINKCKKHEDICQKAEDLCLILHELIEQGWNPGSLKNIKTWLAGDKLELYQQVKHFFNGPTLDNSNQQDICQRPDI